MAKPGSAFATTVLVFIPWTGEECKSELEWLPRQCPRCERETVVGHGRRVRQAHDETHDWIVVRRARCPECKLTMTVLPGWLRPKALYTLRARWEAISNYARPETTVETCAPQTLDGQRIADGSTVRRWLGWAKPLLGIGCRVVAATRNQWAPTILAWDFQQVLFKLNPEARAG